MTTPTRINLDALSLDELARLREMLRVRPGQRSLETLSAIAERDGLVRELAAEYYRGICRYQQSVRIHDDLRRYADTTWVRTRADPEGRHTDRRRRLFWGILKTRGGHVPSVRLVEDILASRTS